MARAETTHVRRGRAQFRGFTLPFPAAFAGRIIFRGPGAWRLNQPLPARPPSSSPRLATNLAARGRRERFVLISCDIARARCEQIASS